MARLETTATYIPATQEFEIHSPTLTSSKWWIGALGKTATHGVVQAKLIMPDGKDMGPHLFFVQLRSLSAFARMTSKVYTDRLWLCRRPQASARNRRRGHRYLAFFYLISAPLALHTGRRQVPKQWEVTGPSTMASLGSTTSGYPESRCSPSSPR